MATNKPPHPHFVSPKKGSGYDSACAAAGQLGLMSLYETLFSTRQVATSQVGRFDIITYMFVCVCIHVLFL